MHLQITQNAQMGPILRMARFRMRLLQIQTLIRMLSRRLVLLSTLVRMGAKLIYCATEQGAVSWQAGAQNADAEFDHCPDVDRDVGPCCGSD